MLVFKIWQNPNVLQENFSPQYLNVGSDVVGTVVKIPDSNSPGLISCEINDDFITVSFASMDIVSLQQGFDGLKWLTLH